MIRYTFCVISDFDANPYIVQHAQFKRNVRSRRVRRLLILMGMPLASLLAAYWLYLSGSDLSKNVEIRTIRAIALILVLTLITLKSILLDFDRRRILRRIDAGKCPRCEYDLRGSRGRCPECGDAFLQLSQQHGVAFGEDSHVFRNALCLIASYGLSLMLIVYPGFIESSNQFAGRSYENVVFALHSYHFDSDDWKNAKVHSNGRTVRVKMVDDLIRGEIWLFMTPLQIEEILGKPDLLSDMHGGQYAYYLEEVELGFPGFTWGSEKRYVVFQFLDEACRTARIRSEP